MHLAWLDHCPNVVIDARASGCHIVCSSAGGTCEISGDNSTIIEEEDWDYTPVKLYHPQRLDFSRYRKGSQLSNIDIIDVSSRYLEVFNSVLQEKE